MPREGKIFFLRVEVAQPLNSWLSPCGLHGHTAAPVPGLRDLGNAIAGPRSEPHVPQLLLARCDPRTTGASTNPLKPTESCPESPISGDGVQSPAGQ